MSINTLRNLAAGLMLSIGSGAGPAQAETLQEALMSAYTGNPGLMAERARVREFDENYVQAQSRGLLSSNLSGSAGWSSVRSSGTGFSGAGETAITHNQPASLQLQVIQPVYQGGRVGALKAQARAGVLSARQNLRNIEQSILLSTAAAYSDVISAEEAARIRRNGVRVLAQQKNAAQARFEVGEGTRTDIALADSRMAAAEIGLAQADARLQVARASYVRATGHMPENLQPVPEFILPQNLTEAIRIGRNNNPQLIAAVFNEEAAEAGIEVAKSARRPSLSINATAQGVRDQLSGISEAGTVTIAAQFTVPLLTGGANSSRVRAAKAAAARSRFETRDLERAVDQAIVTSWANLDAARRSLDASRKQVEAAEFAFEGTKLEQQLGTRSTIDVLNAEQELLEARLAAVNSRNSLERTSYELLAALGAFDAGSLQLPVDQYDPEGNSQEINGNRFPDGTARLTYP